MQCTIPNVFQNGVGEINLIDAVKVNLNFSTIATILNGNIEKDNIKVGSAICLNDAATTVSVIWTFSADPVFNAGGVKDSYLTSNIPKKDEMNVFTARQILSAGIDLEKTEAKNFNLEEVASLPGWVAADKGRLLFCTGDNHSYVGGSSGWVRTDYIGDYTGGAISRYAASGIVDDNNAYKLYFKTEGDTPTVKIVIKGEAFPSRFYTELPYHTHGFTGVNHSHSITDPEHYHTVGVGSHGHGATQYGISTHKHSIDGSTSNTNLAHIHSAGSYATDQEANHSHPNVTGGAADTGLGGIHAHAITGDSGAWSIANLHQHSLTLVSGNADTNQAVPSTDIGNKNSDTKTTGISINNTQAGGTNAHTGVNGGTLSIVQKLYADTLTVKINATSITSNILTAKGWTEIGDGTAGHAFHVSGTGELDASSWLTYSPGLHVLEIIEPESGYGSGLLIHIETS